MLCLSDTCGVVVKLVGWKCELLCENCGAAVKHAGWCESKTSGVEVKTAVW